MKKLLTAAILSTALLIGQPLITAKIDFPTTQTQQKQTYNLECLATEFYDNKSFEIKSEISVFKGYNKYNQYEVNYEYIVDLNGELSNETITMHNEKFKAENAAPVFSMFGEIKPAPNEFIIITKFADGDFSYNDLKNGKYITRYKGKYTSKGIKKWEVKNKTQEAQKKFEKFKKLIKAESIILESKGYNNYEFIKDIDTAPLEKKPDTYVTNQYYIWYSGSNQKETSKKWQISYNSKKNHIQMFTSNYPYNYTIKYNQQDEPIRLTLQKQKKNKTELTHQEYTKGLYTEDQIKDLFEDAEKFLKKIKEKTKDLPLKLPSHPRRGR